MERRLIECVPNISEGRDQAKIDAIAAVVKTVAGVQLLDVDPGNATNRTVITFVGEPEPVIEAAFLLLKKAQELIDMRKHKGEHPRFGATDVCPLVPISGISMEETAEYARKLAERVGKELSIPVYCRCWPRRSWTQHGNRISDQVNSQKVWHAVAQLLLVLETSWWHTM